MARTCRRAALDDQAAVHEDDLVGDLSREAHLVGDDDHRHAVPGELLHRVQDLADELGVQRRGRLVEQHQLRVHRQRPGDRDALLLPTGELRGVGVELVRQPHPGEQFARARAFACSRADALDADRRAGGVLQRRHVAEQVEVLEDHADLGPLAGDLRFAQLVQHLALLAVADQLAVDRQPARS